MQGETTILQKILWLIVASLPKKQHTITQRDILKLGKQKIKVREIVLADQNNNYSALSEVKLSKIVYEDLAHKVSPTVRNDKNELAVVIQESKQTKSVVTNSQQVCRICLDPGQYNNPLITPCKCSGSVKYIHLNCLKAWLAKRLNVVKSPQCITINWLPLSCQMCKASFKYRIYMDNKKFYTVDIPKPPKPYIILQLMRKQSSTKAKIFHFVTFHQKSKINLGRKKDIDVKVSDDISISRYHASIQYIDKQKKFVLTDNKSKFGTLVLVRKGVISRPKHTGVSVQIGAQIYCFDSFRGQNINNFQPQDGDPNQYLVEQEEQECDEDSQQQSEQSDENNDNIQLNQNQLMGSSPQIRRQNSIQSQPN